MSKHTATPRWLSNNGNQHEIYGDDGKTIAIIPDYQDAHEANAALMQAAPEMFDILVDMLVAWHKKLSNMHKQEPARIEAIRALPNYEEVRLAAMDTDN